MHPSCVLEGTQPKLPLSPLALCVRRQERTHKTHCPKGQTSTQNCMDRIQTVPGIPWLQTDESVGHV